MRAGGTRMASNADLPTTTISRRSLVADILAIGAILEAKDRNEATLWWKRDKDRMREPVLVNVGATSLQSGYAQSCAIYRMLISPA